MAIEVVATDEWRAWFEDELDDDEREKVTVSVDLLEARGVSLGFPHSTNIEGSSIALRELRTQSKGAPLRTLYAFDPARKAVLLVGGDKRGDDRFYERMIPRAEKLWDDYLTETGQKKKK